MIPLCRNILDQVASAITPRTSLTISFQFIAKVAPE